MAAEGANAEIKVVSNPDQDSLTKMGVADWPTWGCGVSQFPWTYDEAEICYILNGRVVVTPDDGRAAVSVGAGDLCTFPAGMSCTWDVKETISKHYKVH